MAAHLLIFGASRGTGAELLRLACANQRPVTAVARSTIPGTPGARCVRADVLDAARVAALCGEVPADTQVVCLVAGGDATHSADHQGSVNIFQAAAAAGLRRLLLVTSLGCGESRAFASPRLLEAIGPILELKTRAEEALRAGALDHTILRPGRLFDGPPDGRTELTEDPSAHGGLTRGDLARIILECLDDPATIGKTYSAVRPAGEP